MDNKLVQFFKKDSTKSALIKTKVYIEKYGIWIIVNFGLCLFPFFVMFLLNQTKPIIFSSFLAYNFTLVISSLYLLTSAMLRRNIDLLFWITISWAFLIIVFFVLYPNIPYPQAAEWFSDDKFWKNCALIISVTFIISFFLHRHSIQNSIKELINARIIPDSQRFADSVMKAGIILKGDTKS